MTSARSSRRPKGEPQVSSATAAIYARVSTQEQAADGKSSIERQIAECKALANRDGYGVSEDLVFLDTASGAKPDRVKLLEMKAAAKAS